MFVFLSKAHTFFSFSAPNFSSHFEPAVDGGRVIGDGSGDDEETDCSHEIRGEHNGVETSIPVAESGTDPVHSHGSVL